MMSKFAFLNLGTPELLLIVLIGLLLFGGRKLPELARSLGSSAREIKKGLEDGAHDKNHQPDEKTPHSKIA